MEAALIASFAGVEAECFERPADTEFSFDEEWTYAGTNLTKTNANKVNRLVVAMITGDESFAKRADIKKMNLKTFRGQFGGEFIGQLRVRKNTVNSSVNGDGSVMVHDGRRVYTLSAPPKIKSVRRPLAIVVDSREDYFNNGDCNASLSHVDPGSGSFKTTLYHSIMGKFFRVVRASNSFRKERNTGRAWRKALPGLALPVSLKRR